MLHCSKKKANKPPVPVCALFPGSNASSKMACASEYGHRCFVTYQRQSWQPPMLLFRSRAGLLSTSDLNSKQPDGLHTLMIDRSASLIWPSTKQWPSTECSSVPMQRSDWTKDCIAAPNGALRSRHTAEESCSAGKSPQAMQQPRQSSIKGFALLGAAEVFTLPSVNLHLVALLHEERHLHPTTASERAA